MKVRIYDEPRSEALGGTEGLAFSRGDGHAATPEDIRLFEVLS